MFIYTQQLQVRVAGPNMLPDVVSVSSCLLHVPSPQPASTAHAGGVCLVLMVCETVHTNPRVFLACSRPGGQLTSVPSNSV